MPTCMVVSPDSAASRSNKPCKTHTRKWSAVSFYPGRTASHFGSMGGALGEGQTESTGPKEREKQTKVERNKNMVAKSPICFMGRTCPKHRPALLQSSCPPPAIWPECCSVVISGRRWDSNLFAEREGEVAYVRRLCTRINKARPQTGPFPSTSASCWNFRRRVKTAASASTVWRRLAVTTVPA